MLDVVLRTQVVALLPREEGEEDAALRPDPARLEGLRDFQQRRHTRGVVVCAVVDLVSLTRTGQAAVRPAADVIVVRTQDEHLSLEVRIRPLEHPDHVAGLDRRRVPR
jgi:hypothetical protein